MMEIKNSDGWNRNHCSMNPVCAMEFAKEKHKLQKRKFTGESYHLHLAEVAAIAAGFLSTMSLFQRDVRIILCACWLHDSIEDQGVTWDEISTLFGHDVAELVLQLTDLPNTAGNYKFRQAANRQRLVESSWGCQFVKCCDIMSNAPSMAIGDPKYASEEYIPGKLETLKLFDIVPKPIVLAATQCCEESLALAQHSLLQSALSKKPIGN